MSGPTSSQTRHFSSAEVAEFVRGTLHGPDNVIINNVASLKDAGPSDLTYYGGGSHGPAYLACKAGCALIKPGMERAPDVRCFIEVEDPNQAFTDFYVHIRPAPQTPSPGIHPTAVIDPTAAVDPSASIGPYVVLSANVTIGAECVLHAHCVVMEGSNVGAGSILYPHCVVREFVEIGERVMLQPGAVIGADGFGYVVRNMRLEMVPQRGNVRLGNDVHIGANSAVDRARFATTSIGDGTKIDNLVQIGHNVQIGKLCGIAGLSGVAGSAKVGDFVNISGSVAIADGAEVGTGARVLGRTTVAGVVGPGETVLGTPARDARLEMRILKLLDRLPELFKTVRDLELYQAKQHHEP